jgi:hypothetical protein
LCAPGRAHLLGGESPLHTRQGEVLAERQLRYREKIPHLHKKTAELLVCGLVGSYLNQEMRGPVMSFR